MSSEKSNRPQCRIDFSPTKTKTHQITTRKMLRKVPLIVILGSTGTGKTKLSIELAQTFGGEIISADSMQVYKGLSIATAKATATEQATVPHHLLDIAAPGRPFTVVDFRDAALPIVDRLLGTGRSPIIVGGTNYYIESLLWRVLVDPIPDAVAGSKRKWNESECERFGDILKSSKSDEATVTTTISTDLDLPTATLHETLAQVDPDMAARLHPNNRRKIIRALEIYHTTGGRPMSEILREQQSAAGGNSLGGPLRYPHTIIIWLRCDQTVLDRRLDERIDGMVAAGLLPEIRAFYDSIGGGSGNFTRGILQTIGFKEFIPYLEQFTRQDDERIDEFIRRRKDPAEEELPPPPNGMTVLRQCLAELQMVTRRYSKKQLKWVQNRFVASTDRMVPDIYAMDTTDPTVWDVAVRRPAEDVIRCYVDGRKSDVQPLARHDSVRAGMREDVTNVCTVCDRPFIGEFQWNIHMKSNKHKRAVARRAKALANEKCERVADEEQK